MTEAETKDLADMKEAITRERELGYMMVRDFLRMDAAQLATCGHKTKEAAIVSTMQHSLKAVDKLIAAHIRKYPDDK